MSLIQPRECVEFEKVFFWEEPPVAGRSATGGFVF